MEEQAARKREWFMTDKISHYIHQIASRLSEPGAGVEITGCRGSAPACLTASCQSEMRVPFIVVTPDGESGTEILRELRFFGENPEAVFYFPAWECAPFDKYSPHPDISGERITTLYALLQRRANVVVAPLAALSQRVVPRAVLGEFSLSLQVGAEVEREDLLRKLLDLGYTMTPLVEDRGTASVRGGIVDIFPPDVQEPVRLEFFGDQLESIRIFDPVTQRSLSPLNQLMILPSRELILSPDGMHDFASRLKSRCDEIGIPATQRRELLEQLRHSIYPPGIEYLQPLFHPSLETLFDYAGLDAVVVQMEPMALGEAMESQSSDLALAADRAGGLRTMFCRPEELFLSPVQLTGLMDANRQLAFTGLELADSRRDDDRFRFPAGDNRDLRLTMSPDSVGVLRPLVERISGWLAEGHGLFLVCHQVSQVLRLQELLSHYALPLAVSEERFDLRHSGLSAGVRIMTGDISRGFRMPDAGLVVIAEEEIFGRRVKRRGISEIRKKQILVSLEELKPGDFMVHIDFGLGLYRGLQHLSFDGIGGDFILLEYAGGDRLYLPVDRINLVQRYMGAEGIEPTLDKLGGPGWEKKKARAREAVEEMAEELLRIYAARQVHEGISFSPPDDLYREFEASFAYEETPDQLGAIEDVIRDMESSRPMDRLVCGDVGYGKTEVAMRAAFKAAMDGRQVAVLVPTTVLAQQHMESFRKRFEAYPVTIEMLSRFRSPREQKAILEGVQRGEVDILIGTHRLLQKDMQFKDLGLLVVDEEHRFGVAHKEKLKKFRSVVDVLTLTATPIPRTLNLSLAGIRDLSIIDTPPADRLAIKSFVARFSDELIREAVMRELRRGGQVFFVHNRVQSIGAMAEYLRGLVPEAKLGVGHGQMKEKELEEVMLAFMHGETNLFLCTTIIESGLDIPSANTMIINRADTFGLAQLYQLRGRVGRSSQRAYAYFLIPGEGTITPDARERLRIIQELTELGAGFRIATHDLEIRGAGDFLGARQSGNIAAVGFELYSELLEEAVSRLKGEHVSERIEPEIALKVPAFVPEDYVQDPNQRLIIYKRLAQSASDEDADLVGDEMTDRFGRHPLSVVYLLESMKLRIHLRRLMVKRLEFDGRSLLAAFHEKTPVSPDRVIEMVRQSPEKYRFSPDFVLSAVVRDASFEGILAEARNLLKCLG